jgi:hypothetical protein
MFILDLWRVLPPSLLGIYCSITHEKTYQPTRLSGQAIPGGVSHPKMSQDAGTAGEEYCLL